MSETLAQSWASWDEIVLGPQVSGSERHDLRYAFFCGAMAFSSLLRDAVEHSHGDVDLLKAETLKLTDELNEFYRELVRDAHAKAN